MKYKNEDIEINMNYQETEKVVNTFLETLSEEQRICLSLFYIEKMKQIDIAKELGITESQVKHRLYYGKRIVISKVLELEKQGTNLHNMPPLLFFKWVIIKWLNESPINMILWNNIQNALVIRNK